MQPDPDGLSVVWLEFFGGDRQRNLVGVRGALGLQFRASHRFAVINVGSLETAGSAVGAHAIEDPITDPPPGNPAHALVKEPGHLQDRKIREAIAQTIQDSDLESCF